MRVRSSSMRSASDPLSWQSGTASNIVLTPNAQPKLGQAFRGDRQVASFRDPYLEHFYRVQLVFRHQRVWDAAAQEVRMLCRPEGPLADDDSCDTDYVGPPLPPAAGRLVSCGALDPRTLLPSALFVEER